MIKIGEFHKRKNKLNFKTGSPIMWIGKKKFYFGLGKNVNCMSLCGAQFE